MLYGTPTRSRYLQLSSPTGAFETKTLALPVNIGRRLSHNSPASNNGVFDSKVLSRNHAYVFVEGNKVYIKDLGSANGTFVNQNRLSGENEESTPFELQDGDVIDFGVDIYSPDTKTVLHKKITALVSVVDSMPNPMVNGSPSSESVQNIFSVIEHEMKKSAKTNAELGQLKDSFAQIESLVKKAVAPALAKSKQLETTQNQMKMWMDKYHALLPLVKDMDLLKDENESLLKQMELMNQTLDGLESSNETILIKRNETINENVELRQRLDALTEELEREKQTFQKEIESFVQEKEALADELLNYRQEFDLLVDEKAALVLELNETKAKDINLTQAFDTLQKEKEVLLQQLSENNDNFAKLEGELNREREKVNELTLSLDQINDKVSHSTKEQQELVQSALSAHEHKLADIEASRAEWQQKYEGLASHVQVLDSEAKKVKASLEESEGLVTEYKEKLTELEKQLESAQKEHASVLSRLFELETKSSAEIDVLYRSKMELEEGLKPLQERILNLEKEVKESAETNNELKDTIRRLSEHPRKATPVSGLTYVGLGLMAGLVSSYVLLSNRVFGNLL